MITSSDGPIQGEKTQTLLRRLSKPTERVTGARRRLGHLFEMDERHLIDLQVEHEYHALQARRRG